MIDGEEDEAGRQDLVVKVQGAGEGLHQGVGRGEKSVDLRYSLQVQSAISAEVWIWWGKGEVQSSMAQAAEYMGQGIR